MEGTEATAKSKRTANDIKDAKSFNNRMRTRAYKWSTGLVGIATNFWPNGCGQNVAICFASQCPSCLPTHSLQR